MVLELVCWINGFLTGRKRMVVLEFQSSSCHRVVFGVPQGTVFEYFLPLLYINNLIVHVT